MDNVYVDNKEDREDSSNDDDIIDIEAESKDVEDNTEDQKTEQDTTDESCDDSEKEETNETSDSETDETTDSETDETTDKEKEERERFNYRTYGKQTSDEARGMAEKMLSDVYTTLRSRQSDWNQSLEEYRSKKPLVDFLEYPDRLELKMDLPRVKKDDIDLKMSPDSIEIIVNFPETIDKTEKVKVIRKERCTGQTKTLIDIPAEIDLNKVEATFENNVLSLVMPKVAGKKVDVEIV